jgi:aldehyde dehydrogenase (NAD+)
VLDDANFAESFRAPAWCACTPVRAAAITTRLLLPRSRYDEGVALVQAAFESFPYGDPTDFANMAGPLINAKQRERVLDYIAKGKAEGANCLVGGGRRSSSTRATSSSRRCSSTSIPNRRSPKRRSSAPCSPSFPTRTTTTPSGSPTIRATELSGAINGGSLDRALAMARRIRTGTIAVNGGQWFGPDSPFGGYKESGLGREHGVPGFEEYLETKTIGLPA